MESKSIGVGAIVSFPTKHMHPHKLRDDHFPERPAGHRLVHAVVVREENRLISHKDAPCVIVNHDDFKDEEGGYQDIWCAKSHVKVNKRGHEPKDEETDKFSDSELQEEKATGHKRNGKRLSVDSLGFDDPLRPREGRDLLWRNVNMTLPGKGETKDKKLLDGVWGDVPTKHVTAIMGPSGSGKVSLESDVRPNLFR